MIYLDNAATTYPKPPAVSAAVIQCMHEFGGNPGRGSHKLSMLAAECVYECRANVADLFGAEDPSSVVFTLNTTYALNMAIKCVAHPGDHFLIGNMEHNSVRRPVELLARDGMIQYDVFDVRGTAKQVVQRLEKMIRPNTRAIVCAHASNVCNLVSPIRAIGALCRKKGILFIVDAAQSAGVRDINLQEMPIDILCAPGHKGLYGPQGCGIMVVNSPRLVNGRTLVEGGSGAHSLDSDMPSELPEHFEAGTLPTPAIAGLCEGIKWIKKTGIRAIYDHECSLWKQACTDIGSMAGITIYDNTPGGILLFNAAGLSPSYVASQLNRAGICVRAGLHCAPMAHQALATGQDGAVRISFGAMNTEQHVQSLINELHKITRV